MITGFNTDVEFNGRVYHVQTEDRGLAHPIIESLVYTGGEIVTARKTSYAELLRPGSDPAAAIQALMEAQHRDLMRAVRNGVFSKGEMKPFGHGIVTNRSFDEVVAEFIASDPALLEAAVSTRRAGAPEAAPGAALVGAAAGSAAPAAGPVRRRRSTKRA